MSRGITRERQVKALKERDGYWTIRAAASLGDADVVALKAGEAPEFIEVKSTHRGPFHSFGPQDRADLIAAADRAGAEAWLCWWPPRGKPTWLHSSEWPGSNLPNPYSRCVQCGRWSTQSDTFSYEGPQPVCKGPCP